jgi:hypothetical protein
MIHIRVDTSTENSERKFACGIGPELPPGDTYWFDSEFGSRQSDCKGCNPGYASNETPTKPKISGRPGHPGFEEFCRISASWGYE